MLGCGPRFRMGLTELGRSGPSTASHRSGMRSSERTPAPRRFGFSPVGSSAIGIRRRGPSRRKFFPSRPAKRCNAHGMDTSEHGTEARPWISVVARTRPATSNILVTITASCPAAGRASSRRPRRSFERAFTYLRIPPCTASASAFRSCSCRRRLIGKGPPADRAVRLGPPARSLRGTQRGCWQVGDRSVQISVFIDFLSTRLLWIGNASTLG